MGYLKTFEMTFLGDVMSGWIASFLLIAILFFIVVYVYSSLAWYTIAKKLKYRSAWLAWIPVISIIMILQLGGFHWAWIFLILIPLLGWIPLIVILVIATWKIFEKRNYPGWFSLSMIIPKIGGILYLIAIGFVAWSYRGSGKLKAKKKVSVKKK